MKQEQKGGLGTVQNFLIFRFCNGNCFIALSLEILFRFQPAQSMLKWQLKAHPTFFTALKKISKCTCHNHQHHLLIIGFSSIGWVLSMLSLLKQQGVGMESIGQTAEWPALYLHQCLFVPALMFLWTGWVQGEPQHIPPSMFCLTKEKGWVCSGSAFCPPTCGQARRLSRIALITHLKDKKPKQACFLQQCSNNCLWSSKRKTIGRGGWPLLSSCWLTARTVKRITVHGVAARWIGSHGILWRCPPAHWSMLPLQVTSWVNWPWVQGSLVSGLEVYKCALLLSERRGLAWLFKIESQHSSPSPSSLQAGKVLLLQGTF